MAATEEYSEFSRGYSYGCGHCGASNNNSYFDCILLRIAKLFTKRPCLVLVLTLVIALTLSWIGLAQNGYPEFDNPYLGFETRFTSIGNRLVTLSNFRYEWNRLQLIENYPGEKITEREWKRRKRREIEKVRGMNHLQQRQIHESSICSNSPVDEYARIALELEDSSETFSVEVLSLTCYLQKLIEEIPEYSELCEQDDDRQCCPFWSLTNYITIFSNKTDCVHVQGYDIIRFRTSLHKCIEIYDNETQHTDCTFGRQNCPQMCRAGGILHSSYLYTMDNTYVLTNKTQYTMLIPPIAKRNELSVNLQYFLHQLQSLRMPSTKLTVAGYDFGGKDSMFRDYLISDLKYVAFASVIIFLIVCFYTHSPFVTLISFSVLVLSLGVSYFMYCSVFGINYFPFMNMLVTIVILGIGTDGTLVISIVWERRMQTTSNSSSSTAFKNDRINAVYNVLKETTMTLLITTCTTAGAFLASLTSSITTIKCFSIFSATAIIVSFTLIYICVPTALVLGDLIWSSFHSMLMTSPQAKGKVITKFMKFYQKLQIIETILPSKSWLSARCNFLISSMKFWLATFIVLFSILIWSLIIVLHSPGIQLPSTEQFQLLSNSHPIEVYDRQIDSHFKDLHTKSGQEEEQKLTLYFIWGLRPTDNGAALDPNDNGNLEFDDAFSFVSQASQKWMRKLCKKLQKQNFYDPVSNAVVGNNLDSCFMESMISWMKRDCNKPHHLTRQNSQNTSTSAFGTTSGSSYAPCCRVSKFPYEPLVFKKCLALAARDLYRTPSGFFQPDVAGPKFFPIDMNFVNHFDDDEEDDGETDIVKSQDRNQLLSPVGGQLAVFSLRVKTNVSFSLVYEKMNSFYQNITQFFDEVMKQHNVPPGLENGFVISPHWDYFDLQRCLISETWHSLLLSIGLVFVLLLVSSRSFTVAFGAVLTILATVVVSGAILIQLFSWKLGVFEAIAITVAVGLSDFTTHHTIEFIKYKSVVNMASPTFFSAVTTIIMGLFMLLFSNVLVYQQIGSFFFVLVVVSWLYSVFFLNPVLLVLDKLNTVLCNLIKAVRQKAAGVGGAQDQSNVEVPKPKQNGSGSSSIQRETNQLIELTGNNDKAPEEADDEVTVSLNNETTLETSEIMIPPSHSVTPVPTIAITTVPTASENVPSFNTLMNEKKQNMLMEKWKLLKKVAQETTV